MINQIKKLPDAEFEIMKTILEYERTCHKFSDSRKNERP